MWITNYFYIFVVINQNIKEIETIHNVEEVDGKVFYHIGGVGQALFERDLEGKEDCFIVNENNII